MFTFLSIVYVIVCAFLILVVLLQSGKGGGMGALGGGAGGGTAVFGGAGAGNFLTKMTAVSAALFMILSATLAYLSTSGEQALDAAAEDVQAQQEAVSGGEAEEPEPAGMSEGEAEAAEAEAPVVDEPEDEVADEPAMDIVPPVDDEATPDEADQGLAEPAAAEE